MWRLLSTTSVCRIGRTGGRSPKCRLYHLPSPPPAPRVSHLLRARARKGRPAGPRRIVQRVGPSTATGQRKSARALGRAPPLRRAHPAPSSAQRGVGHGVRGISYARALRIGRGSYATARTCPCPKLAGFGLEFFDLGSNSAYFTLVEAGQDLVRNWPEFGRSRLHLVQIWPASALIWSTSAKLVRGGPNLAEVGLGASPLRLRSAVVMWTTGCPFSTTSMQRTSAA